MQIEPPMGMAIVREDDPNPKDLDPLLTKKADNEEAEMSNEAESGKITKDEEIESYSAACRICLEYDSEPGDELISPCMCKGTQQFVHRSCLNHWRSVKEGFAFSHCTTCKAQFHLRVEFPEDYPWRKIKFRLFVAGDVLIVFLFVQTIIACLGGLGYFLDRDGDFRNSFSDSWDWVLSKHPVACPLLLLHSVLGFVMLPLFSEINKFHNNRSFLKKIRSIANSGRMSGGSHARGDEGEQKQNKLLSLDLSAEGMNANQVSYEVLKLRSKGKHKEADGLAVKRKILATSGLARLNCTGEDKIEAICQSAARTVTNFWSGQLECVRCCQISTKRWTHPYQY